MDAPCRNCDNRVLGCHSTCSKYIDFKNINQERSDKISQQRKVNSQHIAHIKDQKEKRRRAK